MTAYLLSSSFCLVTLRYISNGFGLGVNSLHEISTRGSDCLPMPWIIHEGHPNSRLGAAGCIHLPSSKLTQLIFIGIKMPHPYCANTLQFGYIDPRQFQHMTHIDLGAFHD